VYKLSKQPLIEVAFELHWKNKENEVIDLNYRLLIGSLYEYLKEKFPNTKFFRQFTYRKKRYLLKTK